MNLYYSQSENQSMGGMSGSSNVRLSTKIVKKGNSVQKNNELRIVHEDEDEEEEMKEEESFRQSVMKRN